MRKMVLLLASMVLAVVLTNGVAQAQEAPQGTLDANCQPSMDVSYTQAGGRKLAQTFTAIKSGKLTSVTAYLGVGSYSGNVTLQIVTLDVSDAPTGNVLGSTTVAYNGADFYPITANFNSDSAASVVAHRRYAVVAQAEDNLYWSGSQYDLCRDGRLWAEDSSGAWSTNYYQSSGDLNFAAYVSPPDTTITSGPSGLSNTKSPSFAFTSNYSYDGYGPNFECSLDGAYYQQCSSPRLYYSLPEGTHTFRVRANADGNFDATPAESVFTVDTARPSGKVVINGGRTITTSRKVTLRTTATDPAPASGVVSMRFKNAGTTTWSAWQPYATSKSWTLTSGAGKKTVYVQYRDRASNVSATVPDSIAYKP